MVDPSNHIPEPVPVFTSEQVGELEQMVEKYPWSGYYRTMLAKALKDQGSAHYEHKLELAALYALDRRRLYHMLEGDHPEVEATDPSVPQKVSEARTELEEAITYDPTVDLKPLEQETVERKEPEIPLEYTVYDPEVELGKLEAAEQEDSPHDFMYWLNHVDDGKEEQVQQEETNVDQVQDLLEKFLESKTRKPLEKREFFNPQHRAEASETDDSELVSESLAKLYMKQELWDKARDAYQKLSLQNPARSAYFAALLEEIEVKRKTST